MSAFKSAIRSPAGVTATIAAAILTLLTAFVKFSDGVDFVIERSKPIQLIRQEMTEQKGEIKSLSGKVDDVKGDTKAILRELRRR